MRSSRHPNPSSSGRRPRPVRRDPPRATPLRAEVPSRVGWNTRSIGATSASTTTTPAGLRRFRLRRQLRFRSRLRRQLRFRSRLRRQLGFRFRLRRQLGFRFRLRRQLRFRFRLRRSPRRLMARKPGRPLPLPIRLTATYALLVAATLLVVGGIVMHLTRDHLQRELEVQLSSAANSFQARSGSGHPQCRRCRPEPRATGSRRARYRRSNTRQCAPRRVRCC